MLFLKLLWATYRRNKYEKLIAKLGKERELLKAKQHKYTAKMGAHVGTLEKAKE